MQCDCNKYLTICLYFGNKREGYNIAKFKIIFETSNQTNENSSIRHRIYWALLKGYMRVYQITYIKNGLDAIPQI